MQKLYVEIGVLLALSTILTACTISMQNISTHGTATDLVDENQAATADVKPVLSVPVKP
jgi:hypothetical protein